MGASIHEVAQAAGVSVATVSRVLTGARAVRPANAQAVRAAAKRLGYVPHGPARALVTGRRETVGLFFGSGPVPDDCARRVMDGLSVHLGERNITNLMVFTSSKEPLPPKMVVERHIDGLIIATHWNRKVAELADEARLPVVLAGGLHPEVSCVGVNETGAAATATVHLLGLGHRRIAYVGTPCNNPHPSVRQRYEGYAAAMTGAGADVWEESASIVNGGSTTDNISLPGADELSRRTGAFIDRQLSRDDAPTAYVCYDDAVAAWAMQALAKRSVRVGVDVSVVGFNDAHLATYLYPRLTTVRMPFEQMGIAALDVLLEAVESKEPRRVEALLDTKLVVRESTAPPRES